MQGHLARLLLAASISVLAGGAVASTAAASTFSSGQLPTASVGGAGCGTNGDGEPSIHVSAANNVFVGSERGLGGGSDGWRGLGQLGGTGASGCSLEYRGQPNATAGFGLSGGDIDTAWASAKNSAGNYNLYVASLNGGSVSVSHSTDNGTTFSSVPVVAGIPVDDREWIAAYGASTALLSYHDIATGNIDVLRSTDGGTMFAQTSTAIPATDYRASANELGNIATDRRNPNGSSFWAYQSFVAPSSSSGSHFNEAFVAVSGDGGSTWTDRPVPCSTASSGTDLDHNFPNVSVDPAGNVWAAWSDDKNVYTARSADHGQTWTCSGSVSTNTAQAIFPWLAATSSGVDLVYYASTTAPGPLAQQTFSVYFAQNLTGTPTGWGTPESVVPVHKGAVCEGGVSCTSGRQLLDDFGVDTDQSGWAHIAYSHDSPDLGGSGSYTGYAVQTSGSQVGAPN